MFSSIKEVLDYIRANEIAQIDVKVVDLQGRWRRMTYSAANVTERLFEEGTGISLSPYPGYRTVEQGDMTVRPDISTGFIDPFHARPTLAFICDMLDNDGNRYPRDPRYVCEKAELYLAELGLRGHALFSPELEFYILDGADYGSSAQASYYSVESHGLGWGEADGPVYKVTGFEKIGQLDAPLDRPRSADAMMIMRHIIKNVAVRRGKLVTFMPKPFFGHAGNGIHYHQYLSDGERSLFYQKGGYAELNPLAHQYLCGILEHTPALMGIGNASSNSYRRFAPNLAAPVKLFFGLSNRSSAVRIPAYALNEREARVEFRMPDATANPYLIIAAQLMAGLDGVKNKMDPTAKGYGPLDVNVYAMPEEEQAKLKSVPTSFAHALLALDQDRSFLTEGGVFPDELVDAFLQLKRGEMDAVHVRPHPYEYELYFDL